jgi:anti-sigma regulatory factor (Ser/Thr protein kinase)
MPFAPNAVRTARLNVTVALRHIGVEQRLLDDARMVVSELLGNALRHARPRMDGVLTVAVEVSDDEVTISVADGGSATLPTLITPLPLDPGGRGLAIVRTLTRRWGVREELSGNIVFGVLDR